MAVRSTRLAMGLATGPGQKLIYKVPLGFKALVKWFTAINYGSGATHLGLTIVDPLTGSYGQVLDIQVAEQYAIHGGIVEFVMEPDDELYLEHGGLDVNYYVSGSLLLV